MNKLFALALTLSLCLGLLTACSESGESGSGSGSDSFSLESSSSELSSFSSRGSQSSSKPLVSSSSSMAVSSTKDAFFKGAVFVGDSVMVGFRNYLKTKGPSFLGGPDFLVSGSYSAANAVAPVSVSSIHPIYQGQQHQIQDSIALMGATKVFVCFGINDIALYGVDGTIKNFSTLFDRIKAKNLNVKLYILSAPPMAEASQQKNLNNANLQKLNAALQSYAEASDAGFIDIYSAVADADGNLKAAYCSDGYVHQTPAAYDQWVTALRAFSASQS